MISCKEYYDIRMKEIEKAVKAMNRPPRLLIIQVGDNEASNRYVRNKIKDCEKVGVLAACYKISQNSNIEDLNSVVNLNRNFCDGIILQLPVPKHINEEVAKKCIPGYLDVDGFNSEMEPCTPKGIMDWLKYNKVNLNGKNVTIVGRSDLVGKPLSAMMLNENATVTICHSHTQSLSENFEHANIIVSAAGKRNLITYESIVCCEKRPLIIDVGINFDEEGKMCGDCEKDLNFSEWIEAVTPVPGGVGLLTRIAMLDNLIKLCKEKRND